MMKNIKLKTTNPPKNRKYKYLYFLVILLFPCFLLFSSQEVDNINVYKNGDDYYLMKDTIIDGWHKESVYIYSSSLDSLFYNNFKLYRCSGDTLFIKTKDQPEGIILYLRKDTSLRSVYIPNNHFVDMYKIYYLGEQDSIIDNKIIKLYKFRTIQNSIDGYDFVSYYDDSYHLYREIMGYNDELIQTTVYPLRIKQLKDSLKKSEHIYRRSKIH